MRFEGKTVVVTGGASGIGEATVRAVVAEGGNAVIADLQLERGSALAEELGAQAFFIQTDVTDEAQIEAAVGAAVSHFGGLNGMVNNAGVVGAIGSIMDTSVEAYDHTMSILGRAVFLGMKHAARAMKDSGGAIVSIASTAGVMGGLGPHVYTQAKHGVVGLTKSAASELCHFGIRVNAVAPGNTVTAMTGAVVAGDPDDKDKTAEEIAKQSALGIPGMPEDIASAILFLLSEDSRYTTGHTLVVDAGQTTGSSANKLPFHEIEAASMLHAGTTGGG